MAASDPTTDVPTPTGTLQGVAVFNWDGTNWQPTGRAGPSVATPTGVLRGVAAFNGGPSWQPSGLAQPGVTTPTGTLDGVAVYTWSGSAWTPPGGTATPSTPSGVLRGVAAFNWDGAAWQPAAQAGPSVATPYGVLDGVAMFGWTGSAWATTGAPSLSLDFMTPGTLDPRITFTRASTASYFDSTGTMQTAAINAPRWDYNMSTHTLNGLLIEEARTNLALQSTDFSQAVWQKQSANGPALPVVTTDQAIAPDGTLTADMIAFPAVSGLNAVSQVLQAFTATANPYEFSIYLKGAVGGEQLYLFYRSVAYNTPILITLTTGWQRFLVPTSTLTAASWSFYIGVDLRDTTAIQTAKPAQTIYAWGGQIEQGTFPTSYIPTTAATVTRSQDSCTISSGNMGFFTSPGGSWQAEFISFNGATALTPRVVASPTPGSSYVIAGSTTLQGGQNDGVGTVFSANTFAAGAVAKAASTWVPGTAKACLNAGAVASSSALTTGYAALATTGVRFMANSTAGDGMSGYIRKVSYWPRALSNAELQQVTT